jgi:hypothetical protein
MYLANNMIWSVCSVYAIMMVTGPTHTYSLYLTSIYLHVYYIMMQNFANDVQYGNKLAQCVGVVRTLLQFYIHLHLIHTRTILHTTGHYS